MTDRPGLVVLFGSGETSPSGRKTHEYVLASLDSPIRAAVLETPAGFELNSDRVAGRVADFLRESLQNYRPEISLIPARKRGTPFSPDLPDVVEPMYQANYLFLGPGSPTYAVRQLRDSLAWNVLRARQRLGAAVVLASAATVAVGRYTIPVYEIYKVGEDPRWHDGLDLFGAYGLSLTIVPHWNNNDGGDELDTSRCFIGRARFDPLAARLPAGQTIVGIDERTALVVDLAAGKCLVMGGGGVTVIRDGLELRYEDGSEFAASALGQVRLPSGSESLPDDVWRKAASTAAESARAPEPPPEALTLVAARADARARRDWPAADALRDEISALGWQVADTPDGPKLSPL